MLWLIDFEATVPGILGVEISKKLLSQQKSHQSSVFSMVDILLLVVVNPIIHRIF